MVLVGQDGIKPFQKRQVVVGSKGSGRIIEARSFRGILPPFEPERRNHARSRSIQQADEFIIDGSLPIFAQFIRDFLGRFDSIAEASQQEKTTLAPLNC